MSRSHPNSANAELPWPTADDYHTAMQNLSVNLSDPELRQGTTALNQLQLPLIYSGGIADVYRVDCPATGNSWAVKCFKRPTVGLHQRYAEISDYLKEFRLPFMVGFRYLEHGICVNKHWFPILKMRWVEGLQLNEYIVQHLDQPTMLDRLLSLWVKLAGRLRMANIAHADLQHGNVLLVPKGDDGAVLLRLIDYDGMWVPSLANIPSGELGHANYQHPHRVAYNIYNPEVDRFSNLAICCALRCLRVGGQSLWDQFNNDENLLFSRQDFEQPSQSKVFRELWTLRDSAAHSLVGHLVLASNDQLNKVPLVEDLIQSGKVTRLTTEKSKQVQSILQADMAVELGPIPMAAEAVLSAQMFPLANQPLAAVTSSDQSQTNREVPAEADRSDVSTASGNFNLDRIWSEIPLVARVASGICLGCLFIGLAIGIMVLGRGPKAQNSSSPKVRNDAADLGTDPFAATADNEASKNDSYEALIAEFDDAFKNKELERANTTLEEIARGYPDKKHLPFLTCQLDYLKAGPPEADTIENSIGMKLRWIPQQFSGNEALTEGDQENSEDSGALYLGTHEVTESQYAQLMGEIPGRPQGPNHPVQNVPVYQTQEFCRQLTSRDKEKGKLPEDFEYRLPSYIEWLYAAKAGENDQWIRTLSEDHEEYNKFAIAPLKFGVGQNEVGTRLPNPWGLYDMIGNVHELFLIGMKSKSSNAMQAVSGPGVYGAYGDFGGMTIEEPFEYGYSLILPFRRTENDVSRGGYESDHFGMAESSPNPFDSLQNVAVNTVIDSVGFRVALAKSSAPQYKMKTNSIGMQLVEIPAGQFIPKDLQSRYSSDYVISPRLAQSDQPQTLPSFFAGVCEVSQQEYESVTGKNPSQFRGEELPVESVTVDEAAEFCRLLTEKELASSLINQGQSYRLPSFTEWEYMAQAGSERFPFFGSGSITQVYSWTNVHTTNRVGVKKLSPWGQCDLFGNVSELVLPTREFNGTHLTGVLGKTDGNIALGSNWTDSGLYISIEPEKGKATVGFRVVLADEASAPIEYHLEQFNFAMQNSKLDVAKQILSHLSSAFPDDPQVELCNSRFKRSLSTAWRANQTHASSFGMNLVRISADGFDRGSKRIQLLQDFFIGVNEVTQKQYEIVTGKNPSSTKGDDLPVTNVSAEDADEFCRLLTQQERENANLTNLSDDFVYRLPTDAEWEHATRAGTSTKWFFGNDVTGGNQFAWHLGNAEGRIQPVGQKEPNPWGLCDTVGNVFEWVLDGFESNTEPEQDDRLFLAPVSRTEKPAFRAVRGGSARVGLDRGSSAAMLRAPANTRNDSLGFRVVLGISPESFISSTGMKLTRIKSDEYLMRLSSSSSLGSPSSSGISSSRRNRDYGEDMLGGYSRTNEVPTAARNKSASEFKRIKVSVDYYIGVYEVTVEQYNQYQAETSKESQDQRDTYDEYEMYPMMEDASNMRQEPTQLDQPAVMSHDEAVAFCKWLTEKDRTAGLLPDEPHLAYRLPTSAEWENAVRAGTRSEWFFGDDASRVTEYAWCNKNVDRLQPIGRKSPNPNGLFDAYGNAAEWVTDHYDPKSQMNRLQYHQVVTDPGYDPNGTAVHVATKGGRFTDSPMALLSTSLVSEEMGEFGMDMALYMGTYSRSQYGTRTQSGSGNGVRVVLTNLLPPGR